MERIEVEVGLYCIEISGDQAKEAAAYYEERLAQIERLSSQPGTDYCDMSDGLWEDVKKKFGVEIHVV